jgi:hypothetical protein
MNNKLESDVPLRDQGLAKASRDFADYAVETATELAERVKAAEQMVERYRKMLGEAVNIRYWTNEHYDSTDYVDTRGWSGNDGEYYPTALEAYESLNNNNG